MVLDFGLANLFPHSKETEEGFGAKELKVKTKEFFLQSFDVLFGSDNTDVVFKVPEDFNELVSAEWVVKTEDNEANIRLSLSTSYGKIGEDFETHQGNITDTYNFTARILTNVVITTAITELTPGDIVWTTFTDNEDVIAHQFLIFGVRIKYR